MRWFSRLPLMLLLLAVMSLPVQGAQPQEMAGEEDPAEETGGEPEDTKRFWLTDPAHSEKV